MHYKCASFTYVGCCDPEILLGFIQMKLHLIHSDWGFPRPRHVQDLLQDQQSTIIFLGISRKGIFFIEHLAQVEHEVLEMLSK